ncbi:MAG: tetratricopeptide repeat protein [Bacteroidota bacterium]
MADPIRPSRSGGPKPLFITFYSFKGGVGRTMALLNVANILAGLGRHVLMIDVDLEAPGLTLFQDRTLGAGTSQKQQGLVDAFRAFLDTPEDAALMDDSPERFMNLYVRQDLPFPGSLKRRDGGYLDLLPVGRLDETYERTLYGLDFGEVFEAGVGKPMIDRLKALLTDTGRYDYVLIDSRTGFSDEGSICTRFLGDYLVVLTGLNRQNLRGTARFLERSGLTDRKGRIAMVASPVPLFYEEVRAERLKVAEQMLADVGVDVPLDIQIPYHPLLALDEDPNVQPLHKTDLDGAYQELTAVLRQWANDVPETRIQEVLNLVSQGQENRALVIFTEVGEENPQLALQTVNSVGFLLVEQSPRAVIPLLTHALRLEDHTHPTQQLGRLFEMLAAAQHRSGASARSVDAYEQALAIHREIGDYHREGIVLINLGTVYLRLGEVKPAIEYYEQALDIGQATEDQHLKGGALAKLGSVRLRLGEVKPAVECYELALAIHREIGDHSGEGSILGNLGAVYLQLGDMKRAIEYYEKALVISRATESKYRYLEGGILVSLGAVYLQSGEVKRAIEYCEQALSISREVSDRRHEAFALGNLGIAHARFNDPTKSRKYTMESFKIAEELGHPPLAASLNLDQITALSYLDDESILETLRKRWPLITDHASAFERAQAHVVRARVLAKQGQPEEATESAEAALEFYFPRSVDSVWSREAKEILHEIKNSTKRVQQHLSRARVFLKHGRLEAAAESAHAALEVYRPGSTNSELAEAAREILRKIESGEA